MTVWFFVAKSRKRLDTVDSAWGSAFMVAAWSVVVQSWSIRSLVIALLVTVWSVRLTMHIVKRNHGKDEDPRYKALSDKWKGNFWIRAYVSIFLTQGLLAWAVSVPVVMAAGVSLDALEWLLPLGVALWAVGFVCESVADSQLGRFIKEKSNKGQVLDTGLWRYSRHPNYFGELLQWWSIGLIAAQAAWGWIGFLGSLLLTVLIVFVSGIPPIERRRKDNQAYQDYAKHTSKLIPLPRKP